MAVPLKRVLISDAVDPACVKILQDNGINVVCKTKMPKEELLAEIKKYDGLIVRSDTKVTAEVILAGTSLRLIGRAGTGVDNIDCDAATRKGIIVMNTPGGNSISAAEQTCILIAALARHLPQAAASLRGGAWKRKDYMGTELFGKTLAILGLGRIGREVAIRMQSYGMRTIGFDPIISAEMAMEFNVEKLELDSIWPQADYITVHTPLIPQTKNLINEAVLNRCRRGVRVVNVARGGIVDEEGLLKCLQSGQCGGAALDVFVNEPPAFDREPYKSLLSHPALIATPHLGASTIEAQQRVAVEIAEQMVDLTKGKPVMGLVNAPALTSAMDPINVPWIKLAQALGSVLTGLDSSKSNNIEVVTYGHGMERLHKFLGTATLVGLLPNSSQHAINLINAPSLALEANVSVSTRYGGNIPLVGLLPEHPAMSVSTGKLNVVGTVRDGLSVIVAINDCNFDHGIICSGSILFFNSTNAQSTLSEIIGELANKKAVLTNVAISTPGASGTSWIAVSTREIVSSPESLKPKEACYVSQLTF